MWFNSIRFDEIKFNPDDKIAFLSDQLKLERHNK